MESSTAQVIIAFAFGVIFVVALLILAVKFPRPTSFQYSVFRIILSLASAGVGAMLPGFINVEVNTTTGLLIRAGGALALFVIVYFFSPAKLAMQQQLDPPPTPDKLPNGDPFPPDRRDTFIHVWQSLHLLEQAGENLWKKVNDRTLSAFAVQMEKAQELIETHAYFFSTEDHTNLDELLTIAAHFLNGKDTLKEYIEGQRLIPSNRPIVDDKIRHQIQQNKRWLTRYKNILEKVRRGFHNVVVK